MLYLGVSKTHDEQLHILEALTRKFRLAPDMDLRKVAEQCSFNLTGADFYALCSDALLNAMTRKAEDLETVIGKSIVGLLKSSSQWFSTFERRARHASLPASFNATVLSC